MESYLLYGGAGALFASVLLGAIALATSTPARAGVARGPVLAGGGAHVDRHNPFTAFGRTLTSRRCLERLSRWLDRAGNPRAWPLERVVAARGIGLLAGAPVGAALGALYGALPALVIGLVAGGVVGLHLPGAVLWDVAARRQREISRAFRPSLELLVVANKAGLGFDAALAETGRLGSGPLAEEFNRALAAQRDGESRAAALRTLAGRTTVGRLRLLATALAQAGDLGAPLDDVVTRHADDVRHARWQRAEELASAVPLRLLVALAVCLVPAVLIVLFGPELVDVLEGL